MADNSNSEQYIGYTPKQPGQQNSDLPISHPDRETDVVQAVIPDEVSSSIPLQGEPAERITHLYGQELPTPMYPWEAIDWMNGQTRITAVNRDNSASPYADQQTMVLTPQRPQDPSTRPVENGTRNIGIGLDTQPAQGNSQIVDHRIPRVGPPKLLKP